MDKDGNIIEQLIKSGGVVFIGVGLLFIIIAIVVGVFKQTWLISGVNTMSKEKKAKMDLEYVAKYFGLFFGIFGGIIILGVLICTYLNIMKYFHSLMPILILVFCTFLILYFNLIKRKRIYNKATTSQPQALDTPTKKWLKFIPVAIVVLVFLLVYFGYREPKVVVEANTLKLKGLYGVNLPFAEIAEADTIVWSKMPAISIRTNGISLNKVHRGKFRTTNGKTVHLSVRSGVSPIIRIVEQDGSVYYINRKNATETREIFKKLNTNN